MTRTWLLACLLAPFCFEAEALSLLPGCSVQLVPQFLHGIGQAPAPGSVNTPNPPVVKPAPSEEEPPEEDESVAPEKFVLNPLESERNIRVGNFYWHKKKFAAAAQRYERATRYNPSSAEAFFKLGEAHEKLKHSDVARSCYQKVVQLDPSSKLANEAKRKLNSKG